jgi:N-acetyltransferase
MSHMAWLEPVTLTGNHAVLVPLEAAHASALAEVVREGRLNELWYTNIPVPDAMSAEITRRLDLAVKGSMLPFTVLEVATRAPIGMTTYMNVDAVNKRVEIGSTWYARRLQRTALNTECKAMLLRHAFEMLDVIAVEFRTNFFNYQSRRAIERLGAKFDGILRNHSRASNGALRDTCVYSILPHEWPAVRAHLAYELNKPR